MRQGETHARTLGTIAGRSSIVGAAARSATDAPVGSILVGDAANVGTTLVVEIAHSSVGRRGCGLAGGLSAESCGRSGVKQRRT
jgi:hypothetical protein